MALNDNNKRLLKKKIIKKLRALSLDHIDGKTEREMTASIKKCLQEDNALNIQKRIDLNMNIFKWKPLADDIVVADKNNKYKIAIEIKLIKAKVNNGGFYKENTGYSYFHALIQAHLAKKYLGDSGDVIVLLLCDFHKQRLNLEERCLAELIGIAKADIIIISRNEHYRGAKI